MLTLKLNGHLTLEIGKDSTVADLHKQYTQDVYKHLGYRPAWFPDTKMDVGTVGVFEDGFFRRLTTLKDLGIDFGVVEDPPDGEYDYASSNGVKVSFKAAGELNDQFKILAAADAGALVKFNRQGACLIQLRQVGTRYIANQPALYRKLLKAVQDTDEDRQWQREWVAITEVKTAGTATILISGSGDERVEIKAGGTVAPNNLVDASAGLTFASTHDVATRILARSGLTPLYRGVRVKQSFWWLYDQVQLASPGQPNPEAVFVDADPEDDHG